MIVLPSIDEQKKCPRAVMRMHKAKFCWNSQKAALEEDFAIRKHCRILIEIELTCLFKVVCLKMTVFADYAVFWSLLFANYFVVNVMQTKTFQQDSLVHNEQIHI